MSNHNPFKGMSHRSKVLVGQVTTIVLVLLLWEYASGRWVDSFFVSKPTDIAAKLWSEFFEPSFYNDFMVTSLEMLGGYAIGGVGGVALGVLLARWPVAAQVLDPIFVALNSIPRIALAPLLIIWFGIDMTSKIVLSATLVFFLTFFNTLAGMLHGAADLPQGHAACRNQLDHDRPADGAALRAHRRHRRRVPGRLGRARLPPQYVLDDLQHHRNHGDAVRHDGVDDVAQQRDDPDRAQTFALEASQRL